MPGVGTKQQKTSALAQTIAATGDPQLTPDAVLNDFGHFCIALPATGALIAVRDLSGLRCIVSFGQAPAVGSMVPTDSALKTQCFTTGEFAISEELLEATATDQENAASVATVPIRAQENVVGLIEVFSSQPSAFSPIAIAELLQVAKSFATLMIFDATNDGPSLVGGPLDHPVILPKLAVGQEPPVTANPAPEPTDKPAPVETLETPTRVAEPENPPTVPTIEKPETRKISKPATAITVAVSVNKAVVMPKAVALSQLPSDRPTPKRVWLIAVGLLLALSLLALLLFKVNY